jgi:medium-chain acyl-[acyl-carrier-protein] hydrolase
MNPWLPFRRPRPGARLRLFCFPHAGGGASAFRDWSGELPPDVEVCPVQYPGRETRFKEPLCSSLAALADALASALRPEWDKPFAFFGHSMGALVAWELARVLARRKAPPPSRLIVSGRGAPHLPPAGPPAHALPEPDLVAVLRHYSGRAEELLANRDLLQLFLPVLRADLAVAETPRPEPPDPLPVPLAAVGGLADADNPWHRLDAWRSHTQGPFRLWMLPGGHFYLEPGRRDLLRLLAAELRGEGSRPTGPPAGEVQVWKVPLNRPEGDVSRLSSLLSPDERARAEGLEAGARRDRFIVAQAALRTILGRALGRDPRGLRFDRGPHGRQVLPGEGLAFDLARAAGLALVALARGKSVGIDAARVRADLDWAALSRHALSDSERDALSQASPEGRLFAFFTFQVRKGAWAKAGAEGGASPAPADPRPLAGEEQGGFRLADLHPEPGCVAALVVEGVCTRVRLETWAPGEASALAPGVAAGR